MNYTYTSLVFEYMPARYLFLSRGERRTGTAKYSVALARSLGIQRNISTNNNWRLSAALLFLRDQTLPFDNSSEAWFSPTLIRENIAERRGRIWCSENKPVFGFPDRLPWFQWAEKEAQVVVYIMQTALGTIASERVRTNDTSPIWCWRLRACCFEWPFRLYFLTQKPNRRINFDLFGF